MIQTLKIVQQNHKQFYKDCLIAKERFDIKFPNQSPTWNYRVYNIFNLTFGSPCFYELFFELKKQIRKYLKTKEPLWMQSWLNFHEENEVLDWHHHENCRCHGYLSINPESTKTIFEDQEIKNKIGLLYIGPSDKRHKVVVLKPFKKIRVTIAFDVFNIMDYKEVCRKYNKNINISLMPI